MSLVKRLAAIAAVCAVPVAAFSADFTVLHVFGGKKDGDSLSTPLIRDTAGNLYGTTPFGGAHGAGTVFRLKPPAAGKTAWTESVLFSFAAASGQGLSSTGSTPRSGLWLGDGGTLFGTTTEGADGAGSVFKLSPTTSGSWKLSTVHTFESGDTDGGFPESATLAVGTSGQRIGVTLGGGPANEGAAYALAPSGAVSLLYSFSGPDAALPDTDLVADAQGNLYGASQNGGANGWGAIFQLSPPKSAGGAWTETTIFSFTAGVDGRAPDSALTVAADGSLWGSTHSGGSQFLGNIFHLTPPKSQGGGWTLTNAHEFTLDEGAQTPHSGLTPDGQGGFYGSTGYGGPGDCGSVFHFQPAVNDRAQGVLTVLHTFTGGKDGAFPYGQLLLADGVLYGSTYGSDSADGDVCDGSSVAFSLKP